MIVCVGYLRDTVTCDVPPTWPIVCIGSPSATVYDEYLRKGYPIASGVIEGACRHYVKDRMERTGMSWVKPEAQAMLELRSTALNGDWDQFFTFRIEQETQRLHPHRGLLEAVSWPMAV